MPSLIRSLSRRDAILILVGALTTHFFTTMAPLSSQSVVITAGFHQQVNSEPVVNEPPLQSDQHTSDLLVPILSESAGKSEAQDTTFRNTDLSTLSLLPETTIVEHVPGWTLFRDIYMANGTLLVLTSSPSSFPDIRYMTSTGLPALNTPENVALREPTSQDMDIISPEEALQRWGDHPSTRRVWSVEGNTVSRNHTPYTGEVINVSLIIASVQ